MKNRITYIIGFCIITLLVGARISIAEAPFSNSNNDPLRQQTEIFLEKVNNDIMDEFDIKNKYKDYIIFDDNTLSLIKEDKLEGFNINKDIKKVDIFLTLSDARSSAPIGSTVPLFLISKNGKEIIVTYKLETGENVLLSYSHKNGEYKMKKQQKEGKIIKFETFTNELK